MNITSIDLGHMSVKVDLVQSLYGVIDEIGKSNIQKDLVSSDLDASRKYMQIIMDSCLLRVRNDSKIEITDDMIPDLCEALLHFMLTASTLPSARKIEVNNKLKIDLAIPNLQCLLNNPQKALVIAIMHKLEDTKKISQIKSIQPNPSNIWLISVRPLRKTELRDYSVFPTGSSKRFSDILVDIGKFLRRSGDRSMRFVHS
ncbi:MAG TPA: hypothetical protein VH500_25925 [Nitrososphaeraceae archaeon]